MVKWSSGQSIGFSVDRTQLQKLSCYFDPWASSLTVLLLLTKLYEPGSRQWLDICFRTFVQDKSQWCSIEQGGA